MSLNQIFGLNLMSELIFSRVFQKLYASIRSEPFKIPEDDGNDLTLTFFNPDREGWLLKMGELNRKCLLKQEVFAPSVPLNCSRLC